jgi:triosephosphate isomerase
LVINITMKKHILLINTKAYQQGTGSHALTLARTCRRLSRTSSAGIVLAVQPSDIPVVSKTIPTFAQHIDSVRPGAHTGHILPDAVKAAGARGTLINHSERPLNLNGIGERIKRARANRLTVVCCAPYTVMVKRIAFMKPDYIAIEPPELIGTGVSVSQAKPHVIKKSVELALRASPRTGVLCGAGISTGEDVAVSMELGAAGVLVASSIVKSPKPERVIRDLLKGFG